MVTKQGLSVASSWASEPSVIVHTVDNISLVLNTGIAQYTMGITFFLPFSTANRQYLFLVLF
jgi:hypothetical protein